MAPTLTRRSLFASLAAVALAGEARAASTLPDLGQAPEFTGLERWYNSAPLAMAGLRGRVVLVDFWTHECINCIHTLPHVLAWDRDFRAQGLTIVGVHTPEFDRERVAANVEAAIAHWGIRYPVAQDNSFATWKAWRNQYWPAFYLVDRRGRIRYRHFGEEDYDVTEAAIRALLAEPARM